MRLLGTDFRAVAAAALTESAPEPIRSGFDPLANDQDIAPVGLSAGETAEFEQQRRNRDSQINYTKENDILLAEQGEMIAGRILSGSATARLQEQAAQQEEKAKRAHQNYLDILMAQLDEQIAWYGREIARLEGEIRDMDKFMDDLRSGNLDPNDPRDAARMEQYGVKAEDLENEKSRQDALDRLERERAGKQNEIADLENKRSKAQELKREAEQAYDSKDIDRTRDVLQKAAEQGVSLDEMTEDGRVDLAGGERVLLEDSRNAAGAVAMTERQIIDIKLKPYEGTALYTEKVDEIIADAFQVTLESILYDENSNPNLKIRIEMANIKKELESLESKYGDDPKFQEYVNITLENASEDAKEALTKDDSISPKLAEALYPSFSDEIDDAHSIETGVQKTASQDSEVRPTSPVLPGMNPV